MKDATPILVPRDAVMQARTAVRHWIDCAVINCDRKDYEKYKALDTRLTQALKRPAP